MGYCVGCVWPVCVSFFAYLVLLGTIFTVPLRCWGTTDCHGDGSFWSGRCPFLHRPRCDNIWYVVKHFSMGWWSCFYLIAERGTLVSALLPHSFVSFSHRLSKAPRLDVFFFCCPAFHFSHVLLSTQVSSLIFKRSHLRCGLHSRTVALSEWHCSLSCYYY